MYSFYYFLLPDQKALIHSFMISEKCVTIFRNDICSPIEFDHLMSQCKKIRYILPEDDFHASIPEHDEALPHYHLKCDNSETEPFVRIEALYSILERILLYQRSPNRQDWLKKHSRKKLPMTEFSAKKMESFWGIIPCETVAIISKLQFISYETASHLLQRFKDYSGCYLQMAAPQGWRSDFSFFDPRIKFARAPKQNDEDDMQLVLAADLKSRFVSTEASLYFHEKKDSIEVDLKRRGRNY